MSRTKKDRPYWVKESELTESLEANHQKSCIDGEKPCDLPRVPAVAHLTNRSKCQWKISPHVNSRISIRGGSRVNRNTSTIMNNVSRRRQRRQNKKEARRILKDELDNS